MDEDVKDIARLYIEATAIRNKAQAVYNETVGFLNKRLATDGPMKVGDEADVKQYGFSRRATGQRFLIKSVKIRIGWSDKPEIVASGPIIKQDGRPGLRIGQGVLQVEL